MKRPSYRDAIAWIANNDNFGGGDSTDEIAGYLSVALVADLWGLTQDRVAADITLYREKYG